MDVLFGVTGDGRDGNVDFDGKVDASAKPDDTTGTELGCLIVTDTNDEEAADTEVCNGEMVDDTDNVFTDWLVA